ncbi:MAG TPA: lipopolysaccharide heptosyltransferase II [Planctomycetota bacterium]|nr:lipopolysaccharide heptosyltransferase II [Planctomycetota bacterium]
MASDVPARILIVRLGALGDVVNALALANALVRERPDVEIGWVAHDLALPLLQGHPSIARVHVLRRGSGVRGFLAVVREIRARRYDLALDVQRLTKSALLARWSGAPRRIGFDRARAKEGSWRWLPEHVAAASSARPMAEQALDFARHLGIEDLAIALDLPRDEAAEHWARAWLGERREPLVLLNVAATKPANRWPAKSWGELARALCDRAEFLVALTGGPGDRALADEVVRSGGERAIDLVGATDVRQLIALQRRAALVITADTGPMHTAAAVGAPVLALFGAADERRTGPFGQIESVLRTQPKCAPCGRRTCPLPRHHCMLDLSVATVKEAAERRLRL